MIGCKTKGFWQPMQSSALTPFAIETNSVRLSVRDKSEHFENGEG